MVVPSTLRSGQGDNIRTARRHYAIRSYLNMITDRETLRDRARLTGQPRHRLVRDWVSSVKTLGKKVDEFVARSALGGRSSAISL